MKQSNLMISPSGEEASVYKLVQDQTVVFLVLYVDEILLIGNNVERLMEIKLWLASKFQTKDLRLAMYILEIQIYRDHKNRKLTLSPSRYKLQDSKLVHQS